MLRVLIADDHRLTLDAVAEAIGREQGLRVVAQASSGREAIALVSRFKPDVALVDMHMPGSVDGLTAAERITKKYPDVRVVIISGFTDESAVKMAFRRGADAFMSKAIDPRDIGPALRQVVEGTVFHAPIGGVAENGYLPEGLTERECTVLKGVAAGQSNKAIAKRLWVTEHTIKFHLTNIFRKIDATNRTEAARWAHQHGLVEDLGEPEDETPPIPLAAAKTA
jgi:DNA-binding NarL/FixJ family response regulator